MSSFASYHIFTFFILFLNAWNGFSQSVSDTGFVNIPYFSGNIEVDGLSTDWKVYNNCQFSDTATLLHSPKEWSFEITYDGMHAEDALPPKSHNSVRVMYCWNLSGLYFAFSVKDLHLMAEIKDSHDNPQIFLNDGVEVYIDTHFDSKSKMDINDYQFLFDVLGNYTVFKGDRNQLDSAKISVPKDYGQNIVIETASSLQGTLNDSLANDEGYFIEVRIPFEAIGMKPSAGMRIKLDICNNDNDYSLENYDLSDLAIVITRPFNWAGLNNFGFPDYWKEVELTGEPDWFDKASVQLRKKWLISTVIVIFLSVVVLVYILFRLKALKRIPQFNEVAPAQVLFIKQNTKIQIDLTVNQKYLQNATDYILANCKENISSEDVANHLCISLRKFQLITKEELKCTPTSFIYLVKLNKAAEFIKNNQGNITDAAYNFGFSSPSYFTKIFKNHFGVTPIDYKKNENTSHNSENSALM